MLAPGGDWPEPVDSTVWLRFNLHRPETWPVADTALVAQRFGSYPLEGKRVGQDQQRMQGVLYLDGKPYHGLDQYHRLVFLLAGPDYRFAASVWTGFAELGWQPNPVFRLVRADSGATLLHHDLRVLVDAIKTLEPFHPARPNLERLAEQALITVDWTCPGSPASRASLARRCSRPPRAGSPKALAWTPMRWSSSIRRHFRQMRTWSFRPTPSRVWSHPCRKRRTAARLVWCAGVPANGFQAFPLGPSNAILPTSPGRGRSRPAPVYL